MKKILFRAPTRLNTNFNETSQISERYSTQMKAVTMQKFLVMLGQIYLSMIECPKPDKHVSFCNKRLYLEPTLFWPYRTFIHMINGH